MWLQTNKATRFGGNFCGACHGLDQAISFLYKRLSQEKLKKLGIKKCRNKEHQDAFKKLAVII
jgi:hypothetical protein